AAAPLDDVLALWSGLGYYSRARNLHRCAQAVAGSPGGLFPRTSAALAELPGIGRSTAAAIAAFCYGERAAILDGNVKRVLARYSGFAGDLAQAAPQRELWALAEALLPERDVDLYTQGLMDLGATLCPLRAPACARCPLRSGCVARAQGRPADYPVKSRRLERGRRSHALLWLRRGERHFLVRREARGVWAGLWSLPEHETADDLQRLTAPWPGAGHWLAPIEHALTHFDWTLQVLAWQWPARARPPAALPDGRWVTTAEALALGLPAPLRVLLSR
ncbi:MAG: A/G-specific adenine glycosylase, partial [Burkholderiales bacterium]|nr:A/G-specific adenine glycosylase [Burkholderiales bacterium]